MNCHISDKSNSWAELSYNILKTNRPRFLMRQYSHFTHPHGVVKLFDLMCAQHPYILKIEARRLFASQYNSLSFFKAVACIIYMDQSGITSKHVMVIWEVVEVWKAGLPEAGRWHDLVGGSIQQLLASLSSNLWILVLSQRHDWLCRKQSGNWWVLSVSFLKAMPPLDLTAHKVCVWR